MVYFLWPYLNGDEPKSRTESRIESLVDVMRERDGFVTIYLRNVAVTVGEDTLYDPFGYPTKSRGTLGKDNRPSPLDVVDNPAGTWLMHDVDKGSVPGRPGWYDQLPDTAYHGRNIVLYFDAHCEAYEKFPDLYQ